MTGATLTAPPVRAAAAADEDALGALLKRSIAPRDQAGVYAVLEQMGANHPAGPHWYLPLVGVDPLRQGRGYGSALLECGLARCDRDHTPAYLESTNPMNNPLYERYGFEVLGTIQVGASPPIWPMVRKAR